MADKKINLEFQAKVSTDVGNVKTIIANLKNELGKLQIPAGATKGFEHSLNNLNREVQEFEALLAGGVSSLNDTRKLETSWKRVTTILDTIGVQIKDLGLAGDKIFPKSVTTNIEKANKAMTAYQQKVAAIRETQEFKDKQAGQSEAVTKRNQAQANLAKEEKRLRDLQVEYDSKKAAWDKNRATEYAAQQSEIAELTTKINQQTAALEQQKEVQKQLAQQGVVTQKGEITDRHSKAFQKVDAEIARLKEAKRVADEAKKAAEAEEEAAKKAQSVARGKVTKAKNKHGENSKEVKETGAAKVEAENRYAEAHKKTLEAITQVEQAEKDLQTAQQTKADLQRKSQEAEDSKSQVDAITKQKEALEKQRDALQTSAQEHERYKASLDRTESALEDQKTKVETYRTALSTATTEVQRFDAELEQLELDGSKAEWEEIVRVVKEFTGVDLSGFQGDMSKVTSILERYKMGEIQKSPETMKRLAAELQKVIAPAQGTKQAINGLSEEFKELNRAEQDMERLKNQVLDFFSLSNAIQIFKNAIRDAFETVKELDAAMTETAVVTDFSVGDMWDKLPQYSEEATKLGASIKSLYEATTLYYQQGLNSEQAMSVGIETMKMARIANMDAASATEAMTAALRGFNMEINEMSATRINDVYSELAAITAADTSQIATAMSKTASIAESANMEFETTAALLAQIIETTQEAPETAGTAMKTIIARFTEVKQLFSEGMLTGKDSEGEEININKIDAALKTVGISLKDFLNGSKGIDDIFLELASKWDTLDLATQRYIATTAAGSRQQSRFLAMMGNYDRTMELVNAANNSAGASQEQFNKTLESLEAKLQRLKNAWAEFTMGLANSDAIKFVVDLLTSLIENVNKLTGLFGNDGLGGFVTMLIRLTTVIASLKSGEAILNGILKTLTATGASSVFGMDLNNKKINIFAPLTNDLKLLAKEWKQGQGLLKNFKTGLKEVGTEGTGLLSILVKYGKYIGIFTLLAGAVLLVAKAFKEAQNNAKLEAINESIEGISTETEKAKEELSEITSARQKLNEMNDTFGNLTKGTSEWTSALIETNSQVLGLLEKYSILKANIGEHGQLVIDNDSWNDLLAQQQQVIFNMNAAKLVLQSEREQLQASINLDSFIINSKASETQKKMTEWDLKLGKFYDSEVFGIDGTRWGDVVFSNPIMRTLNAGKSFKEPVITGNTGGLTEKQIINLAEIFAYNGAAINENYEAQYDNLIKQLGEDIDVEKIKTFLTSTTEVSSAFNDLITSSYGVAEAQKNLTSTFVGNAIANSKIAKEKEAETIGNIIAKNQNASLDLQVDSKVEEIRAEYSDENGKLNAAKIAEEYATIMGYENVNGEVYTDATYSTPVQASYEAMLRAIATDKITVEVQTQAKSVWDTISTKKTAERELFKNFFSQDGKEITAAQINTYQSKDGKIDFGKIFKDMGLTVSEAEASLGMTIDEITEMLTDNFKNASDRISKERRNLTRRMTKYSPDKKKNFETNANDLMGLEEKFGEQIRYTLEDVLNSLERTEDFDVVSQGFEFFKNVALSGTKEDVEELTKFIDNVDWSDPIASVYKLNKEIEDGTALTKGFAQTVMEVDASFFSASSQFEAFFASDVYKDIQEDLDKIYDTQGKITEDDVRELASEYSYLNKMMKNTSTTAKGLADILQSIEEGKLEFEDLTDAVIAAAGGMNQLGDSTNKVLEKLKNLDLGDDLGEVQDTYTRWADMIKEFQEGGEFGNPQYKGILQYIFGKGFEGNRTGQELIDWYQTLGDKVEKLYGEDMFYGWEQAAKGLDIYGQAIEKQGIAKLKELGIQLEMVNGEVVFNVPDDMTFDQTAANLAEIVGGTKEHWEDMLTYFANRTPEMWRTWDLADYNQIGKRVAEEGATDILGHKFVTNQDVENITTQASIKYADKDPADIRKEIEDQLSKNEVEILTLLDTEDIAAQAENIMSQLNNIFGGDNAFANQFVEKLESGINSLDFTALMSTISALPIPENVGEQIANSVAAGVAELGGQITYEVEGETRVLDLSLVANGTEFVEAVNAQVAQAEEMTEGAELESTASITVDEATWQASVNSAKSYVNSVLSGLRYPVTAYVSSVDTSAIPGGTRSRASSSSGRPKTGSSNRYVAMAADGDPGVTHKHDSLVGEEGPELIETKDGAYLSGVGGPQVTTLHRGDIVHTAEETQEIFKRKGMPLPSFSKGGTIGPASSGSSGGSSTDNDEDTWENPFDKLYNLIRKIDEEIRERERIERRYEKLLESIDINAEKIIDISLKELNQLAENKELTEQRIEGRESQINKYQKENSDLKKYAYTETNERGEMVLRIDWNLINQTTDQEKGKKISEYVEQLEEWFDDLQDAEDDLEDIADSVEEIKKRGQEQVVELEELIKDALVSAREKEIEKLEAINTTISDKNAELIDAVQNSIDRYRQDRENEEAEQNLSDLQERILYLQQDTSGINDLEILNLQEQYEKEKRSYTDNLIDQKISTLQSQNEEAAKQRERQITILNNQLQQYINSGKIWKDVERLINEGTDVTNGLKPNGELYKLLQGAANFDALSKHGQMNWLNETNHLISQALGSFGVSKQLEDIGVKKGTKLTFTTESGNTITGTVDKNGNVIDSTGYIWDNVYQGYDGKYHAGTNSKSQDELKGKTSTTTSSSTSKQPVPQRTYPYGKASETSGNIGRGAQGTQVKAIQYALNELGFGNSGTSNLDGNFGSGTKSAVTNFQRSTGAAADGIVGVETRSKFKAKGFKTGGLADYTGPAWLDGTKSRPELVLNQRDTQNFIQLKNALSSFMNNNLRTQISNSENSGEITYDIDINVESVSSDYDVEQIAAKIKSMINSDARYRNNNAISLTR